MTPGLWVYGGGTDVSIETGFSNSALNDCGSLYWSPSVAKRRLLDREWGTHLSRGLTADILTWMEASPQVLNPTQRTMGN